jgi:uncharacterized membrane protein
MSDHLFLARCFLIGGAVLAIAGLILWFALPISTMFPPFLATGVLALGYGAYCWSLHRSFVLPRP